MTIPVIDLSKTEDITAKEVGQACQDIGFFAIINHGVNQTILDRAWNATRSFFDLDATEKMLSKTWNETEYPYGYEQSERLNLGKKTEMGMMEAAGSTGTIPTDLKETFSIGPYNPQAGMPPRRFPKEPPEFQSALEDYYVEMEQLAKRLLRIFAIALDLPEDWFESKMTHHLSALRALNYFEVELPSSAALFDGDSTNEGHKNATPMIVRASEHTDYGVLTILKSGGPGLQVKKDITTTASATTENDHEWVDVPSIPDAFIINIGDLMQRWTNDKWVSTLHRVLLVPTSSSNATTWNNNDDVDNVGAVVAARRQSMAFFCNVNGDTLVSPLETCVDDDDEDDLVANTKKKYPPITARQHIMNKHLASMGVVVVDEL